MSKTRELVESILNEGWFGAKEEFPPRIEDYIEEYLICTFMRCYGLYDEFPQEYLDRVKKTLQNEDVRFEQLDNAIEKIVEEQTRGDIKLEKIGRLLSKNGADMDIYDNAFHKFYDEAGDKNPRAEMDSWEEWGRYEDEHGLSKAPEDQDQMSFNFEEDTVKQGSSWVNKGEEGTHGKFDTKKEADDQRKAMFANGYKG